MTPEGIILAAGLSHRSGDFKLLRMLNGRTVLECSIAGMAAVCERIVVVGGFQAERLKPLLAKYPGVELVFNPDYAAGMFTSVKTGVRNVLSDSFFILPGDIPLVPEAVYRLLAAAPGDIAVPAYRGRRGHPVHIRSRLIPFILAWPDGSTLAAFIRHRTFATVAVAAEEILLDLDTAADYQRLIRRREDHKVDCGG